MVLLFGAHVRKLRKELGMTQKELAKLAGVTQSAITQIEVGGTKKLKADTLLKMSAALKTNPYHLMTGLGDNRASAPTEGAPAELVEIFLNLSPENQAALLAAARGISAIDAPPH